MSDSQNTFMRIMDIFSQFLLLNIIWIVSCLPVITIFPATTALFGVVRKWTASGAESGVFSLYVEKFKENFRKSFIIGLIWTFAGIILFIDAFILLQNPFSGSEILLSLLLFISILYLFTALFSFFMLVHYELSIKQILKNSLFLSLSKFWHSLLCVFVLAAGFMATYFFPFFLVVIGSLTAFIIYQIQYRITLKLPKVSVK